MANTFNAITTGTGGIATTGDSSGSFAFQKDGVNKVTISDTGVIGATAITGLTTALSTAQGGTGLTAAGTSGNVLTSDGTNWTSAALPAGGVTSLNGQTGAITNTDLYAIGSYVNGRPQNGTNYAVNSTIAGSSLYSAGAGFFWSGSVWYVPATGNLASGTFPLVNTGTWRCVSPTGTVNNGPLYSLGLWVRIS